MYRVPVPPYQDYEEGECCWDRVDTSTGHCIHDHGADLICCWCGWLFVPTHANGTRHGKHRPRLRDIFTGPDGTTWKLPSGAKRSTPQPFQNRAIGVYCPKCEAPQAHPCKRPNGRYYHKYYHQARIEFMKRQTEDSKAKS